MSSNYSSDDVFLVLGFFEDVSNMLCECILTSLRLSVELLATRLFLWPIFYYLKPKFILDLNVLSLLICKDYWAFFYYFAIVDVANNEFTSFLGRFWLDENLESLSVMNFFYLVGSVVITEDVIPPIIVLFMVLLEGYDSISNLGVWNVAFDYELSVSSFLLAV
jgi:hypothetical protein